MVHTKRLVQIIEGELAQHPRMTAQDLQKLVYQGIFGADHLLVDPSRFADALRMEWSKLPNSTESQPVLQTIDPAGRTARLHLAPCKARGVRVEEVASFLQRQPPKNGRRRDFEERWREAVNLAGEGKIPFLLCELSRMPFPLEVPHHSRRYGTAAYRVVNDLTETAIRVDLERLGILR